MPPSTDRLPYALTAFGLPHVMGYLPTKGGVRYPSPLGLTGLMDAAQDMSLAGVDVPLPLEEAHATDSILAELHERGLAIVTETGAVLDKPLADHREFLNRSAKLGARVARFTLSHVLCGDRRTLGSYWETHMSHVAECLRQILPVALDLGVSVAVENHQDATSDDLLRLADMVGHSQAFGITLDAGNPLSVAEDPLAYTRKIAHLVRHIHLKDYTIHYAPEGYRLVRCAAGSGVVDFAAILGIVRANGHALLPGIEIAAQQTRTIPILEPDWWACYPLTPAAQLAGALSVLWQHGRPVDESYSSAWERGEDSETVAAEEWDLVRQSVAYFAGLSP